MHSHVVWGIDDGARTRDEALRMLRRAARAGTTVLFATPHVAPGYPLTAARRALRAERVAELRGLAPAGLELRAGWEVTPDPAFLDASFDLAQVVLEGTEHVLVDGPQNSPWTGDDHLLPFVRRIRAEGLVPIVAHPERRASQRHGAADPGLAERLREAGALLQLDASGLSGHDGPAAAADARRLLAEGLADLIGSDAHGGRPDTWPVLDAAHADAARIAGDATALRLATTARTVAGAGT